MHPVVVCRVGMRSGVGPSGNQEVRGQVAVAAARRVNPGELHALFIFPASSTNFVIILIIPLLSAIAAIIGVIMIIIFILVFFITTAAIRIIKKREEI